MARFRRALLAAAVVTFIVGVALAASRHGSNSRSVATTPGTQIATANTALTAMSSLTPATTSSTLDGPQSGGAPPTPGSDLPSASSSAPVASDADEPTSSTTPPTPIAHGATTWPMPSAHSSVWGAVTDRLGRVWFADGNNSQVDMVQSDGSLEVHQLPDQMEGLARAGDGGVWVATQGPGLGHFAADGSWTYRPLPEIQPGTGPRWVAESGDGSIWLSTASTIWRILPSGEMTAAAQGFGWLEVVVAGDGAVWTATTVNEQSHIYRIDLSGAISDRTPRGISTDIYRLTAGLDGSLLLTYGPPSQPAVARLRMDGTTTSWVLNGYPADGDWPVNTVTDTTSGRVLWACKNAIGVAGGQTTRIPNTELTRLIAGTDGRIWFTDFVTNQYGYFQQDAI